MAILTPSSSSSIRPNRRVGTYLSTSAAQARRTSLTDLDGLDLDTRLDMSFFRSLIDRVRQDLGLAEGVDKGRAAGSRSAYELRFVRCRAT